MDVEAANGIFKEAAQRLEHLLKEICAVGRLAYTGKGGLGTYMNAVYGARAFAPDVYRDLQALVTKRNLVTHDGMMISTALAQEYCVVCTRVLSALQGKHFADPI